MKYNVGIKIYNSFEVEANSEEEAEEKVRELDVYKTLDDCDYNITYVDEVKPNIRGGLYFSDGTIICDDEHGNAL